VRDICRQMEEGFDLYFPRKRASENTGKQLDCGLNQSFRPPGLLAFEGIHFNGEFGRTNDMRQIQKLPASHLRAIAEIRIFCQRVMLPSTGRFNRFSPPDSCCAVEIEKASGKMASAVLDNEMAIENHGFDLS